MGSNFSVAKTASVKSLPQLKLYLPPTSQASWSKRPWHISLSSSLWTDLLMVAILFRLNEFALAHLLNGYVGVWQPITVFFAVYDVWETRVLFDSVFRYQDDLIHHLLGIVQWLLLALMATTITPSTSWRTFDALLFSSFKLAHQSIRVFNYCETCWFSQSKRARKAASVRSIVYIVGLLFNLTALLFFTQKEVPMDIATGMWVAGFFMQRLIWAVLKWDPHNMTCKRFRFARNARAIKTNIPFKTKRYSDWTMLQLGAIVLGLMTIPVTVTSLGSYSTLIFAYTYVAALNLLAYSMSPEKPEEHALIKGGLREFLWLELFSVTGLALMGIAVGLRVHLFYPTLVVLEQNRHYTWTLCVSATIATIAMFCQEYCHGGQIARLNGPKVLIAKLLASGLYTVSAGAFIASNTPTVAFLTLGLALTSLIVLVLQILNGAFKRQVIKTYQSKLIGHVLAVVIAMVLKTRVQNRLHGLPQKHENVQDGCLGTISVMGTLSPETGDDDDKKQHSVQQTRLGNQKIERKNDVPMSKSIPFQDMISKSGEVTNNEPQHSVSSSTGNGIEGQMSHATTTSSLSSSQHHYHLMNIENRARRMSETVRNEIRIVKIVLNERIYTQPHIIVEGNKVTKYKVQWSDLFFDILYVGVVFRLGDLLLAGIGAGYSESSVHYEVALGGSNMTYTVPHERSRSDAVFIFASTFVAVWAMWQSKLAYSSKVTTNDVVHKLVDMFQGLFVLFCAVSITTPKRMQDPMTGNAYTVAGALLAFQLSMVFLWMELYRSDGKTDPRARGTALRNIKRELFAMMPIIASFGTIYFGVTFSVTTLLWSLSWLQSFIMRVLAMNIVNDHNAVRDLHRYVIHRLGDGALIILGEGVLQIIRAKTFQQVFSYLAITLGLFVMTLTRIAVWSMDCFTDPSKHAQLLSLDAGLAAFFIRSITAPALVAMGVALKIMVSIDNHRYESSNQGYYWLLTGASAISLFSLIVTYELHRFAYHRKWRKREFAAMSFVSLIFLAWAPIPLAGWVIQTLCLVTWLIAITLHFFLDDYFQLKEQIKKKVHPWNRAPQRVDSRYSSKTHDKSQASDIEGQWSIGYLRSKATSCMTCSKPHRSKKTNSKLSSSSSNPTGAFSSQPADVSSFASKVSTSSPPVITIQ